MSLTPGARLGPYEVGALIGVGGMGEVYRAADTNLKRAVAIKVLPASVAGDADRLARFQREAEVLASLNHPNIAQIHGLEKSASGTALVMELVEGPTLADRIAKGPIPVDEALEMARQIAEALEAAHERGIIHRDLKPGNVKIRPDGTVKVLDFGLAKATEPSGGSAVASHSPTITSPAMTQIGMILGTAAYMSPEQARGKAVDKRADIWAFGCVLYEMLTAKRAFDADDVAGTLARIIERDPDWTLLPRELSPAVTALCRGCLAKNVRDRVGDFSAVRFVLAYRPFMAPTSREHDRSNRRALVLAGASIGLLLVIVAGLYWRLPIPVPPRIVRSALVLPGNAAPGGAPLSLAISRDGQRIVYVGNGGTQIFVRPIETIEPVAIVTSGRIQSLTTSPDGKWVAFVEGAGRGGSALKKVAITGGATVLIAELAGEARGLSWGEDDTIIVSSIRTGEGLRRISSGGGEFTVLTKVNEDAAERDHVWPRFLPGARAALFTILAGTRTDEGAQVAVLDLATGTHRVVLHGASDARYISPGYIIYGRDDTLYAVPFDLTRLEVSGTPIPVLAQVGSNNDVGFNVDIASDGTLVNLGTVGFGSRESPRTLAWVDRNGREEPIPAPSRPYAFPRLSPDGTMVALYTESEERDLWVWHFTRHTLTRLTVNLGLDWTPLWSPDGNRLYYSSSPPSALAPSLAVLSPDGTGTPTNLTEARLQEVPTGITPDGMQLVFAHMTAGEGRDLHVLTLGDKPRDEPLIATRFEERNGIVSADGHWLAYASDSSGRLERFVLVRSTPVMVVVQREETWRRTHSTCASACCGPGIVGWTCTASRPSTRSAAHGCIAWCSGGVRRARSKPGNKPSFGTGYCRRRRKSDWPR